VSTSASRPAQDDDVRDAPFSDFLGFEQLLAEEDRDLLSRTRAFLTREVEPVINDYWTRAEFPHELVPGLAGLGIAGLAHDGPGCPGRGALVGGMVAMELSRIDPSIGTFIGVHGGLAMGSIRHCGSPEQQERWLPAMARMELLGAFGLTGIWTAGRKIVVQLAPPDRVGQYCGLYGITVTLSVATAAT